MIRVVEFVTSGYKPEERASHKLEDYFKEFNIKRRQIISITTMPGISEGIRRDGSRDGYGDAIILVYKANNKHLIR